MALPFQLKKKVMANYVSLLPLLCFLHVFIASSLTVAPAETSRGDWAGKFVTGVVQALRGRIVEAGSTEKDQSRTKSNTTNSEDASNDEIGPWKPMEQKADDTRNLCQHGKQVPDFYVLGVQKCATTSLAEDLMLGGVKNVHGDQNPKEFHWFELRMNHTLKGSNGLEQSREEWLRWMPECPSKQKRSVLADFTPDYAKVVPHPKGTKMSGPWPPAHIRLKDKNDFSLPKAMRDLYTQSQEKQASRLQFALMIREPLSQMQAAWYHAQSFDFQNACLSCRASSFRSALETHLKGFKHDKTYTMWLWTMHYGRQLEEWLKYFHPKQFYIIPMNEFSSGDSSAICRDLSERLDFAMDCGSAKAKVAHAWSHEHPPVDEDASKELREEFDKLFDAEKGRLVKLLTEAHSQGMGLANYRGRDGDEDAVRDWLEASW